MDSAAPKRNEYATVRAVLRNLQVASGDTKAAAILQEAFSDPELRDDLATYLGPYLSRVLTGSIPDFSVWEP